MKKNLLIMMMMVLCAGFVSAQTINTVRGFVPGGSTNSASGTYAAFGQPFATIANNHGHEVSVGLAQMQLVTDSITDVVTCGQGYHKHGFDLTEEELQELLVQCENEGQRGYLRSQKPNVAVQDYYYDSLVVIDLYVCPCTTTVENEEYEVIALNGECWFKENMRNNFEGSMLYTSELNSVDPADPEQLKTFGRLYTYEATISGAEVCEDGEIQGICPEKWHLPTVDEVDPLFTLPAENLRVDGHWIVDGNNNMTEFSAQPAGYYNSISQRFEGMLTETDFWMVDCDNLNPEDNQLPVLQLIYSCNTPLKPNRPKEDAISVRCVYNIVKMLEDCEPDQNPNTNPVPPTPQYTCPSVSFEPSDAVFVIPGTIASYGEIMDYISSVAFDGLVRGNSGDPDSVKNEAITGITADGVFAWQYQGNMPTEEILGLDGDIVITFDNGQVCKTHVSKEVEPIIEPTTCPSLGNVQLDADLGFTADIVNATENTTVKVIYVAGYTTAELGQAGSYIDNNNGVAQDVTISNNSIEWNYNPTNNNILYLTDLTAGVIIYNGGEEACDTVPVTIFPLPCPAFENITVSNIDNVYGVSATFSHVEGAEVRINYVAFYDAANEPDTKECDFSAEATPIISVSNTKDSVYCSYEKGNDYVLLTPNKIKAVVSLWNQGADYPCAVSDSVVVYEATPAQEVTCPTITNLTATLTTVGCEFVINEYDADYIVEVVYTYSNQSWTDNNPTVVPGDNNTATVTSTYGGTPYGDNALYATVRVNTVNANCGNNHIVTSDQVEIVPSNEQTGFLCPEGSVDSYTSTSFTVTYTDYQQVLDNNASGNPYFIIHYTNDYESNPIYETNPSNGVEFVFGDINLDEVEYFKYFIPASVKSEYQYACPDIANSGYITGTWTPSN